MEQPIEILKASKCRCVNCGERANVFWPCIEGGNDELRELLDVEKDELFIEPQPHCLNCMSTKKIKLLQLWHDRFDIYETERRILLGF